MGLRINNNIPALGARRQAEVNSNALNRVLGQLGSGLRINRAADDAAGLAISERFRTQIRQFTQEAGNLQSGVNAIQTAEGGLSAQQDAVGRIRELAVQAANGTLTDDQRAAINDEAQQLLEQIDQTAEGATFNEQELLTGTGDPIELGTAAGDQIAINPSTVDTLDTAETRISQNRAGLGAQENRLTHGISVRETTTQNLQESESMLRDLDVAVLFAPESAKEAGDLSYSDLRVRLDEITKRNTDLINLRLVSIVFKMEIIFKGQRIYTAGLYDAEEFEMLTMSYYQKLNDERREILENFRSSKKAYAV